ncbi:HAMP domain-containing histidine kinase [Nocardioides sp. WL0053]|uniref:Sensor histidine kinase MtrB n=1 Tax=Nocardioides jiangsuensis TaxID=2866161 RepID=A0ABS7RN23_9ACTN|nr:MtrAB system histidine kinase MtrB [Nocardioides jiangsuensis]MBY9076455.1 HAMP domain-containing histidine kinase [Nocardioides jiangsuensis]
MRLAGPIRRAATFWRRSIQARVVVSTLLLSAAVVTLVGWFLLRQITDGLVAGKTSASVADATRGAYEAQVRLEASGTEFDSGTQLAQLVASIVARGDVQGYDVVLDGPVPGSTQGLATGSGTRFSPDISTDSVPARLREVVESTPGTSWTYAPIRYQSDSGIPTVPGIVAGSQITLPSDGGTYALYYLFPMTEQQETLSLVRRALLTGGVLLLLLVGGLTWLVTRQVVTPVRLARRVAERLASGRLEERMHVRGDDDIARLGTSFNQMAASLQKQIRQLEELSRVQRRFVSDVSHELRTPLTTVRMAGDVLYDARERFDPVTARSAELLQKELDRFELLLTDLLEISRFDAGAAVLDLEDVNLVDLALRVAESTKALADRRGTRVVVHRPDQPCVAEVDVRRVERILRNLFTNAIDYADGHDVDVLLAANEDATALAVRDHGIGLAQGESAMVFNRFWRADPARARTTGGTGLGLSIALEDAHLHGGWLQAWGEPGNGAQFRLTLPRRAGDRISRSPLSLVPADAATGGVGAGYARLDTPKARTP